MAPLKPHPHLVRLTAAVLIATVLQACTSWHGRPLEPTQFSPSVRPGSARLTLTDGSRFTVLRPVIRGDSLFGNRVPQSESRCARVEEHSLGGGRETDVAMTILLVVDVGLTAAIVVGRIAAAESNDPFFR